MIRLKRLATLAIMILMSCYMLVLGIVASFPLVTPVVVGSFAQPFANNAGGHIGSDCSVSSSNQTEVTTQTSTTTTGTMSGTVPSAVRTRTVLEIGPMSPSSVLHMELVFKIRNRDQFSRCLTAISDPSSPEFRHFLNATTLAPFIETPSQEMSVINFLEARGLTVTQGVSPLVLNVTGTAASVQNVLQVHMKLYRAQVGHVFYSADMDPTFPHELASGVEALTGLDNYTSIQPAETPCSGPYCAQAVEAGYSMTSLYSNGFNGNGVTVAVVDAPGDPNAASALHQYDVQYGLPDPVFHVLCGAGNTWGSCGSVSYDPGWASEAAMDIEAVHAMAPGAAIDLFYVSPTAPADAIDYIAINHLAQIVSNSWTYVCGASCSDSELPSSFVSNINSRLALDAAIGLTILFATGDQGAKPDGSTLGPEFPASDPNVLAVGATNLNLAGCGINACTGYSSEDGASISGGGYSGVFAEPSWQVSSIGTKPGRGIPDVSIFGFSSNFWVYSSYASDCGGGSGGGWFRCAGTSLSTPLWAGFLAVLVQLNGGVEFGNVDPLIYQLASSSRYSVDFHDITSGSNNGYTAGTGWDPVSGWGTPVGAKLALDIGAPRFTVTNSGGITVNQGSSGSLQVTINLNSGPTVPITLACTSGLPRWSSCSFSPSSGSPSYTSTLTVSTEPSTPAGSFEVLLNGTTRSASNSTSFILTVNQQQQSCTQTSLTSMYNCPLSFVQGWNLISLPVVPVANSTFPNTVSDIFGSNATFGLMSNVTTVFTYTSGGWQFCTVTEINAKYACTGTLTNLVDGKGYWVYAKLSFTLNNANNMAPTWGGLLGSVIPPASSPPGYSLTVGWNLIGYKPQPNVTANENVTSYLQSLSGDYDVGNVWIYDNSNQTWVRANSDTQLKPSEAMWILMTAPATLRP